MQPIRTISRRTCMRPALVASATLALLALTACGTEQGSTVTDPAGRASTPAAAGGAMPTSVPADDVEVIGVGTVLDAGRPELCLGPVAESAPPQCSGIPVEGWDWRQVRGTFESSGGTRWGGYAVTGTYDGTTLTLTQEPVSSALYDPAAPEVDPLATLCPEPDGGWTVVDPGAVGYEDQDAVLSAAMQLTGYAGSFVDQTQLLQEPDSGIAPDDASQTIVNVLVTEDVAGAEKTLREIWGGALCVAMAEHPEQELIGIQDGLQGLPGLLSSGAQLDAIQADVVWDDGSLQAWADATYGEGLVDVRSALRPVG